MNNAPLAAGAESEECSQNIAKDFPGDENKAEANEAQPRILWHKNLFNDFPSTEQGKFIPHLQPRALFVLDAFSTLPISLAVKSSGHAGKCVCVCVGAECQVGWAVGKRTDREEAAR